MAEPGKVAWVRRQLADGDVVTEDDAIDLLEHYDRLHALLGQTRDALQLALAYAEGELPDVDAVTMRAEFAGCREALRLATEAVLR
ncbi:hypothetical protein Drose_05760 [Dactylosporangium roseum]|uniref:Uncharacterized protein n=1 Tax=Dactylosporangium roseum TaxID=47989 RepID=A0ABY5Z6U9_9ACTN|nr:hypothetical protein [Dactylosporangium roseum]UWZ37776.1 hypothetical protein Drose_05760 [Dactylosporangium roseum]